MSSLSCCCLFAYTLSSVQRVESCALVLKLGGDAFRSFDMHALSAVYIVLFAADIVLSAVHTDMFHAH